MTILETVRKSFSSKVLPLISSADGIDEVFVSGSVAGGTFYDSWSDVDIIVVSGKDMPQELLGHIAAWRQDIMAQVGCKVGIDYVSSEFLESLRQVSQDTPALVGIGLHFLGNFHEENVQRVESGLLYRHSNYQHVSVIARIFVGADLRHYVLTSQERVSESWLRSGDRNSDRLVLLRITTKECLYLLQKFLLQKDGTLVTNYLSLIDYYSHKDSMDLGAIESVYAQRSNFATLTREDIEKYLVDALLCYRNIYQTFAATNIQ